MERFADAKIAGTKLKRKMARRLKTITHARDYSIADYLLNNSELVLRMIILNSPYGATASVFMQSDGLGRPLYPGLYEFNAYITNMRRDLNIPIHSERIPDKRIHRFWIEPDELFGNGQMEMEI